MSSSVTADAVRDDEWDRGADGAADDVDGGARVARREARILRPSTALGRVPPWPQRRLNDALAEMGPMRPQSTSQSQLGERADEEASSEPAPASPIAPDVTSAPPGGEPASQVGSIQARTELPPPPRPFVKPVDEPLESVPAGPDDTFALDDAVLSDVDPAGADIVRALAFADLAPSDEAASQPLMGDNPVGDIGEQERPPMIIERALAEQGLGMMAVVPASRRINPVPALAVGFSLSLLAGAALYLAMAG